MDFDESISRVRKFTRQGELAIVNAGDLKRVLIRLAELEKDAARYRWIRKNCDSLETPDFALQGWIFVNNGCTKLDYWVDERLSREA